MSLADLALYLLWTTDPALIALGFFAFGFLAGSVPYAAHVARVLRDRAAARGAARAGA